MSRIFSKEYIRLEQDRHFLKEIMSSKVNKRIVWSFVHFLGENAISVVNYADIIIKLCENILCMDIEELRRQWDTMFERQLGTVREVSRALMER